jgi:Outer membrane protein beta-barrel domain
MKSAIVLATSLLAISTTASAGTYLGLGLGAKPALNANLEKLTPPQGRSLRGFGGLRFGNFSIEGALNGFDVLTGRGEQTVYQLSGAAKLNVPLGNNFEVLGRAGLERTWLNMDDEQYNLTGDGFLVGAGFEYRLDAVLTNASLFVDYTVHHAPLEDARHNKLDETSRIWALGFTIGI